MSKGCMFCPRSLHYDFAGHLRMNRAEVGISSPFAEGEGELLVRVEHFGLEDLRIVRADHGVRDVIASRPCDCAGHLRMNRAEVGISSPFAEGEGELLVRVE